MPCNSDHMEPTTRERQYREAAQLLIYVYRSLGLTPIHPQLRADAASIYGGNHGEKNMGTLCGLLKNMTEVQLAKIVYDGRNPEARRLADWWDEHKAEDAKREQINRDRYREVDNAKDFIEGCVKKQGNKGDLSEFASITGLYYDEEDAVHVFELNDGVVIYSGMDGWAFWRGEKL